MSTVAVAVASTARPSQALRQRRESQRPTLARTANARAGNMEPGTAKEETKRFTWTQQDVLTKWKGSQPSMRVYLHQNHFRLNDSQESLSYASPMKLLLKHLRDKTVPHDMLDDFYFAGIPFYDGCLIVEVHDYRSGSIKAKDDASSASDGTGIVPFSIHNHNQYITPSPHVPYPSESPAKTVGGQASTAVADGAKPDKDVDKENMPAPGQPASQKQPTKAKVVTVVLFPTSQSHDADIQLLATTAMTDPQTFRRNQAAGRAAGNPPTPLTAVPPTPTFPTGRSPKRQKMVIDETNVHEFEAAMYLETCPKLYLKPTHSLGESVALIEAMTHPNNKNPPPPRKSRKRTTAELAADEAEAADIQRFMLAGDEFQASKTAAATGGDEAQPAVRGGANFQTFSRFKTLESIKMHHEEAERRKKEEDARAAQAKRELDNARRREEARQAEQNLQKQQDIIRQQQAHQAQQTALQQEAALRASQAQQMANAPTPQISQTPQSATQPQFSSPVVRQNTPMVSSPMVSSHPMGGTPMMATSSNHGAAGSPARPPSAVQHAVGMARTISQQQNQPMSRTGTPMIQGTPVMGSAGPARNMASTPQPNRMSQGSPTMPMQGGTPVMMQTPSMQGMTPDQLNMARQQQHARLQAQAAMQARTSMGMNPNQPMTPQQLAQMKAQQQISREGIPGGHQPQVYKNMLAQRYLAEIQQQQQQHMGHGSPQGVQMPQHAGTPQPAANNLQSMNAAQLENQFRQRQAQLMQQYGNQANIPPQAMHQLKQFQQIVTNKRQQEAQAQATQMQMSQSMQGQMTMGGGNGGAPQNPNNPIHMQQYQAVLQQQQRQRQAQMQRAHLAQQQAAMQNGQMPQNMMNAMQMQNMQQNMGMQNLNMQNMQNMAGMNMGGMGNMNAMGMGGMQGVNVNGMQQAQQQMLMRQMIAQRQQLQQGQGQGGNGMEWSGV